MITQKFGERPEYYSRHGMKGHNGLDLRTRLTDSPSGKRPVLAVLDGTVCETGLNPKYSYGLFVRLSHNDGSQTIYAHLSEIKVKNEQAVKAGQTLGLSGKTGESTGPHLHFGYRPPNFIFGNGYKGYVDPGPYLP